MPRPSVGTVDQFLFRSGLSPACSSSKVHNLPEVHGLALTVGLKSAAPAADILPPWQAQALPWTPTYILSAFSEDLHAVNPSPFLGSSPKVPASAPSPYSPRQPCNRSSAGNFKFTQRLRPHSNSCMSNTQPRFIGWELDARSGWQNY